MRFYRRACRLLADEGVKGLGRRALRHLFARQQDDSHLVASARTEFDRLARAFAEQTRGLGDLGRYYWYHTIDLGNGLVTPGDYDHRPYLNAFRFPADLHDRDVLDVGAATGYFSFELERRGARVVSVELPSLADWDVNAAAQAQTLKDFLAWHQAATPEEAYRVHLDGPFQFCRDRLGSHVRRCYCKVYDLTPERLGVEAFDLVFLGEVLIHTFSPLQVLDRLAALCRRTLVVSGFFPEEPRPLMHYLGGDEPGAHQRSWWLLSRSCLEQMLRKVGFREVSVVGRYQGVCRRDWRPYQRTVIHATK